MVPDNFRNSMYFKLFFNNIRELSIYFSKQKTYQEKKKGKQEIQKDGWADSLKKVRHPSRVVGYQVDIRGRGLLQAQRSRIDDRNGDSCRLHDVTALFFAWTWTPKNYQSRKEPWSKPLEIPERLLSWPCHSWLLHADTLFWCSSFFISSSQDHLRPEDPSVSAFHLSVIFVRE